MDNTQIQQQNNNIAAADQIPHDIIASLVLNGDLSRLTPDQKVDYYNKFCSSLGVNPLTQPFEIIVLNGKHRLYAKKDATEQLRRIYGVSVDDVSHNFTADLCIVTVKGHDKSGRSDSATGAVSIKGLQGEALANAIMKAETKAKRRFTLSICGLGMLDETEVDDIPKGQQSAPQQKQDNSISIDLLDPNNPEDVTAYNKIHGMFEALSPRGTIAEGFDVNVQWRSFYDEFKSGGMTKAKANKMAEFLGQWINYFKQQ